MPNLSDRLNKLRKELCHGPCGQSNSVLQQREDRDRLLKEAIYVIERLIKTEDGVPMVFGDKVHSIWDLDPVEVIGFVPRTDGKGWYVYTNRGYRSPSECYSDIEAVEKARSNQKC